jgi:DNA-directed RNA polymerase specialized sigma24 family protein
MGIEMDGPPDQMSLAALEKRCQREIINFRKGEAYNDQYCLEIFYRALKKQDDEAWELLMRNFRGVAVGWLRSHPRYRLAMRHDSEENYVVEAFARLWRAKHDKSLDFDSLAAALAYLKRCLSGTVLDMLRAYDRQMLQLPEPATGSPEEPVAQEEDDGRELWEVIQSFLPTEREKRVAYLMFHCNLKPREIMQHCPGMFSDVKEVYHLRRNIEDRLMRNRDQIRWRLSDEENK